MVIDKAKYITFSNGGATFDPPMNPGAYPTTVDENNAAVCEKQVAEHKESKEVILTHEAIAHSMQTTIVNCIDEEWLAKLQSETMGFNHGTPKAMLGYLRNNGEDLDHLNVTKLITKLRAPWDGIEAPATFFARGDRIKKQLVKRGQSTNPPLCLAFALAATEATGEYKNTLRECMQRETQSKRFPTSVSTSKMNSPRRPSMTKCQRNQLAVALSISRTTR